jgi:hypothetical protein
MAAKRLRAAPTRLARALFWLGRSPIALTLEKRILEAPATPGRPGVRKIAARFGVNPETVQRISRPFVALSVVAIVP